MASRSWLEPYMLQPVFPRKVQINKIALYYLLSDFQDELYVAHFPERLLSLGRSISNMKWEGQCGVRHQANCLCGSRQVQNFLYTNIDHKIQSPAAQKYWVYLQLKIQLGCDCSVCLSDWLCVTLPYMRDGNHSPKVSLKHTFEPSFWTTCVLIP